MRKYILIIVISITSCVEIFDPNIDEIENGNLVIEGLITNEPGPYQVKIARSRSIEEVSNTRYELVSDAEVSIRDKDNNSFQFEMASPGIYRSNENDFIGEIGNSYQLVIEWKNSTYESSFEKILPNYVIDSIYAEFEYLTTQSEIGVIKTEPVINIYADISYPNDQYYYRYDWEATYEARTPLQGDTMCWADPKDIPIDNLYPFKRCYVSETSSSFLRLFTSNGLSSDQFKKYLIYTVNAKKRLQVQYSPLIKQFALTHDAYNFWHSVENQSSNAGGLFDTPPSQINGNIENTDDSNEIVLGYFTASSVTSIRSFFLPSLVPLLDHYGEDCSTEVDPSVPFIPPVGCCECTLLPFSTSSKPDFWKD